MADIRCPMCGKTNTGGRETCRYCNARLTPLIAPPPAASTPEEVPDWLSSLRDGSQQEMGQESSFDGESEAPDWLSRLGGDTTSSPADADSVPDWFANLDGPAQTSFTSSAEPGSPARPTPGQPEPAPLPDWFTTPSTSGTLDWLAGGDEPPASAQQAEAAPWEIQPNEQAAGLPEASVPQASVPQVSASDTSDAGLPDWMAGIQGTSDMTGWLSESNQQPAADSFGLGDLSENAFIIQPGSQEESVESSEWLSDDQSGQSIDDWFAKTQDTATPKVTPPAAPDDRSSGLPDWLSSLNDAPTIGQGLDQEDDGSPDWLGKVRARRQADEDRISQTNPDSTVNPFVLSDDPENDLSFEWLKGSAAPADQDILTGNVFTPNQEAEPTWNEPVAQPTPLDDTPDWLRNLNNDFGQTRSPNATAPLPELDDEDDFAMPANGQGDPDWLAELSGTPGTPIASTSVPAFVGDEDPLAIVDDQPEYAQAAPDTSFGVTPDWLASVSADDVSAAPRISEADSADQLEPANLPTWLEAMRPVDAVSLQAFEDTADARIENAGPLAGLRGALPAEISNQGVRPPAPYTIKLPITEDIEARLAVLKSLLESENSPSPQPQKAALSSSLLLRMAAFFILVLAVVLAMYFSPNPTSLTPLPSISPAALSFQQNLLNLSSGSRVLLALDFEPGYSAELNTMLQPVLAQLQKQGVSVTAVSSSLSGALLIEQAQANLAQMTGAPLSWRIRDLGYLPGGPAGLLAFALEPALIIPVDVMENKSWADAGLNPQAGLENFSLVIVATDNARNVSAWAEQVSPILQQKQSKLLMISSAQSAAVIEPYYATYPPVVSGYLSGLRDAEFFTSANPSNAAASETLRNFKYAYSAALLVVILFVVLGGIIYLAAASLGVRKQPKSRAARGEAKP